MSENDFDVANAARLARLRLTAEETQLFREQLGQVLKYADKLREVDVSRVETAAHASPIFDVFREDEVRPGLSVEEALNNAPRQTSHLFIVAKVLE